ncbi:MAG TPA: trypsin-like peptidase domain-containing protein, partial [Gaiellaceae bacterium]|nr:trypsin-like peptidase domain-containing protein [Gaiellaceae bacterium]
DDCSDALVPGLTRRLMLAVLATLAPAVAASPAGAAGHSFRVAPPAHPNAGIVDVYTTLGYQSGVAAGTGMILTPSGEVLTNNHVIEGATKFKVVDVVTHKKYNATVVGYSVSRDIAVLKLAHAWGLRTVKTGSTAGVRVGQQVVARGNAQGLGGRPKTARGRILALHRKIVAKDEGNDSETLTNLIATNAPVVPGYSGGPLEDAKHRVIGVVTAGSTAGIHRGFAIPIKQALLLARQIENGKSNSNVHVGPTAFLGVTLDNTAQGVVIIGVVPKLAADDAGLVVGDIISSLDGKAISSVADIRKTVLTLTPGKAVDVGWTDKSGTAQTGSITPTSGPPQ